MPLQQIEFPYFTGFTLQVELFDDGSDTVLDTQTAVEQANRQGIYVVDFDDETPGPYRFIAYLSGAPVYTDLCDFLNVGPDRFLGRSESVSEASISLSGIDLGSDCPTVAEIWGHSNRTLTQAITIVSDKAIKNSTNCSLSRIAGTKWQIDITNLGDINNRDGNKLLFTVRDRIIDRDNNADSLVHITESSGLMFINGATATTSTNGSISVVDPTGGSISIVLSSRETEAIKSGKKKYDLMLEFSGEYFALIPPCTFEVDEPVTQGRP